MSVRRGFAVAVLGVMLMVPGIVFATLTDGNSASCHANGPRACHGVCPSDQSCKADFNDLGELVCNCKK